MRHCSLFAVFIKRFHTFSIEHIVTALSPNDPRSARSDDDLKITVFAETVYI